MNQPSTISRLESRVLRFVGEEGLRPAEIQRRLEAGHEKARVTREHISRIIGQAIRGRRLIYSPPLEEALQESLLRSARQGSRSEASGKVGLEISVARAEAPRQIATIGASRLLTAIEEVWSKKKAALSETRRNSVQEPTHSEAVTIGVAGGITCALVVEELASLIVRRFAKEFSAAQASLPRLLSFVSINGVMANGNPTYNPTSYFHSYLSDFPIRTALRLFPFPGVVTDVDWDGLRKLSHFELARRSIKEIDIIVASGGHWGSGHATVCDYVRDTCAGPENELKEAWNKAEENLETRHGCVGDVFWRPISADGPITAQVGMRTSSLFELSELPEMIENQKKVVIVLGPCSRCLRPKDAILRGLISAHRMRPCFTHLIVNSSTAVEFLKG